MALFSYSIHFSSFSFCNCFCFKMKGDAYEIFNSGKLAKEIRLWGYFYLTDDGTATPYRCLEFSHPELPLEKYLSMTQDEVTDFLAEGKQYSGDMTEKEVKESMANYYSDCYHTYPGKQLSLADVTMDTPYGDYYESNEIHS